MNRKQKILTYVTESAIAITSLFCGVWAYLHSSGTWAKRGLASSVLWFWVVIAGIYGLIFAALREARSAAGEQTLVS